MHHAGLHVTIGCRSTDGKIKTMGSSEFNDEEKFRVILPQETIKDGVIRKQCYAQVHSASNSPCPLSNSQETSNIIFQYKSKDKFTISHSGKLNFSPVTCTSKFLWPFHKPKWLPVLPPQFKYPTPRTPILTREPPVTPSSSPSDQPVSTISPPLPQPEDVPPAVSPAYANPLPNTRVPVFNHPSPIPSPKHKNYPPSFSSPPIPKSKQPSLPKLKDLSPTPAPSFHTPASQLPDKPLPFSPSPIDNAGFSPAPTPSFYTPASPPPDEALPSGLSPSPLANNIAFPPHVPSFRIPQPPPIPKVNRPSPPAS